MKKIYSIKERIIYSLLAVVLGLLQLILFLNFRDNTLVVIIVYTCAVLIALSFIKLFEIPYHIVIDKDTMKVYDFPLLATNKFYRNKRSLILWNSEINLHEIETIELVRLDKYEKIRCVGYNHLFNRYIKVSIKNSNSFKYVYVSNYSNSQIERIIKMMSNNK